MAEEDIPRSLNWFSFCFLLLPFRPFGQVHKYGSFLSKVNTCLSVHLTHTVSPLFWITAIWYSLHPVFPSLWVSTLSDRPRAIHPDCQPPKTAAAFLVESHVSHVGKEFSLVLCALYDVMRFCASRPVSFLSVNVPYWSNCASSVCCLSAFVSLLMSYLTGSCHVELPPSSSTTPSIAWYYSKTCGLDSRWLSNRQEKTRMGQTRELASSLGTF